jgi:hypothetical protein
MIKECEYCGEEFEASRSDAKYCSGTCKNNAYLARKANPDIAIGNASGTNNSGIMSHRRQNVNPSIPLSPTSINKMLQGLGSNAEILNNLLTEKDNAGEAKASLMEYRIRLMFMERDLKTAEKRVEELEKENDSLLGKVEASDEGFIGKIMHFCETNPTVLMGLLEKFNAGAAQGQTTVSNVGNTVQ